MPTTDLIAFLSLIVGLSAYLATIRVRIIDKIGECGTDTAQQARKKKLHDLSVWLTLADAPLVIAGLLLFFHGFWAATVGLVIDRPAAPSWFLPVAIWLFTLSIVVLAIHHAYAWKKSVSA
ncbi:MAG: hypothetical protein ACO1PZ_00170 [Gammaproteobacteria bacterium]